MWDFLCFFDDNDPPRIVLEQYNEFTKKKKKIMVNLKKG